jgi:hypothetical protein
MIDMRLLQIMCRPPRESALPSVLPFPRKPEVNVEELATLIVAKLVEQLKAQGYVLVKLPT